ncbi:MAG: methyltransferase domain-containing protein [Piscirickettsiaceae bacterium]|jgi:SAM-dependent methyltransferase|nr:methyltransferase domain-containing protein [Piscirickettsiaceae bacterium]
MADSDIDDNIDDPLTRWWQSPLGHAVLKQEQQLFQSVPEHFHGYYQLQVGGEINLLPEMVMPKFKRRMGKSADVAGANEALPFKSKSLDTLLLSHILEFSADPHQVLREAERVLVGDGTMIICCFNPWSLWGVRRLFSRKISAPWNGHFFGKSRIKDWLSLLNFDVIACEKLMFRPPVKSEKWLQRAVKFDTLGHRFWPIFSGVKVLVATKRTVPLTPVAQRWRPGQIFPKKSLVTKPATRDKINGPS